MMLASMPKLLRYQETTRRLLDSLGDYGSMFLLRCLLAYEFWESGVEKFMGENWFAEIQGDFPFPFNVVPAGLSWFLATWTELLGSVGLLFGLATRFWAAGLIVLDVVAWISVHADHGYNVCNNGWKFPLIFLVMLVPLLLNGPGKLSFDHIIRKRMG